MKFHMICIISTFLSLVSSFHILDLQHSSNIDFTDDHSNKGLINSAIVNNWSQSLNIGSVSLCACLLLMLVGLVLFLILNDRMSQTEIQLMKITKEISDKTRQVRFRESPNFLPDSKITFKCKCTRKVHKFE